MVIRNIVEADIPDLIRFNIRMFQDREDIEEIIKYRLIHNPVLEKPFEKSFIALDENGEITGQVFLLPTEFWFQGKKHLAFWGTDYIVSEETRGPFAGTVLAMKIARSKYHFGATLTEPSFKLFMAFKEWIIAYSKKYIRFISPLSLFRSILPGNRPLPSYHFPDTIHLKGGKFIKTDDPGMLVSPEGYWNYHVIEFLRDEKFIKWRFFYYKDKYCVYRYYSNEPDATEKPTYFVIRPIIWKRLNCLLLVDYRFPLERKEDLAGILKATIAVARKLRMAAILAYSSLPEIDGILKRKLFINYGKNTEILTNLEKVNNDGTERNDPVLVTFADSDMDLNY
jgi:hypothetical protein